MSSVKSPCKGCKDRFYDVNSKSTCHKQCPKYRAFTAELEKVKKKEREERLYWEYRQETAQRLIKNISMR